MAEKHQPSKVRKARKLSRFLCQELMYDYVCGRLDDERNQAMKEYLEDDFESQAELESMEKALGYCDALSKTELSDPLFTYFRDHKNFMERTIDHIRWKNWPTFLKWGVEASLISAVVGLVWVTFPWQQLSKVIPGQTHLELAAVENPTKKQADPAIQSDPSQKQTVAKLDPDKTLTEKNNLKVTKPNSGSQPIDKQLDVNAGVPSVSPPKPAPIVSVPTPKPEVLANSVKVKESARAVKTVKVKTQLPALKGVLFRGFMKIKNSKGITLDVVKKIKALGGEKAGNVKLGWEKKTGNYFHFSLPESNYQVLLDDLRQYGPVRIFKDPHWRVMPEGTIRFILMIEDENLINQ